MFRPDIYSSHRWLAAGLFAGMLMVSPPAYATILWNRPEVTVVCNNGQGEDILHGAIKPQDSNSASTIYFRLRFDPIADAASKTIKDFDAGFVFVEKGEEHMWIGSSRVAWAYCAGNVPKSQKGFVDFNSATPDPPFKWEYIRAGTPKYIAFKVEFVPGHDAHITAWLNPDLGINATEINQPGNIVTRFDAPATFDEIHLIHRGGLEGWQTSQIVAGTSFEDLRLRHFWQNGPFITVMCGLMLALVVMVTRLAERRRAQIQIQLLERERAVAAERARIARDIHDDLGASLTKIHKVAEMMGCRDTELDSARRFSREISGTALDAIQAMDEIVWAVNPQNDTLNEMADYLVYFADDFLKPTGIACESDVSLDLPEFYVNAEVRHNLFMVVKEALNNAVKHAAASQIKLRLRFDAGQLLVEVFDNGKGFSTNETKEEAGNGLENMRKRMLVIGGTLGLHSEPGEGTIVKLQVPLRQNKAPAS